MPSYKILDTSTPSMIIADITHDDGTVRTNVGFIVGKDINYTDSDSLKAELARVVQANQDTHYAIKAAAKAKDPLPALIGKKITVEKPAPVVTPVA